MKFAKDDDRCFPNTNKSLGIDQACVSIINNFNNPVSLFSSFENCDVCDGVPWANISGNRNTTLVIPTNFPQHIYFIENNLQWCHSTYKFIEHGHYGWNLSKEETCSNIYKIIEPTNPYLPILAAFMVFTIASLTYATANFIIKVVKGVLSRPIINNLDNSDLDQLQESESVATTAQPSIRITRAATRIRSIDTFRGIAILLMIFVNNGGGQYVFFRHSPWYGITIADFVLPWFTWIMGMTIVLSLRSQLRLSIPRSRIILKCLRRSIILILLGLIVNGHGCKNEINLQNLRFTGVLQLLGISHFICASIETIGMKAQRNFQHGRFAFLQDVLDAWIQWLIVLGLTAAHLLITFLLPVENCPKGYLGPGGYEYRGKYENCTGGAAGYIDRLVFGNHSYMKTKNIIYGTTLPHDPEGLLNTLSAVLIVQFGVQAGRILFCYYLHNISKILRWFSWAVFIGIIAGFICGWDNTGIIPISKNMMTISFVLITSSSAFILFAILYYLIDHRRLWNGAPFVFAGTNSIFLYIAHYFAMHSFPWAWQIQFPTHATMLAMNLWTTILWAIIAYGLYQKDFFLTI